MKKNWTFTPELGLFTFFVALIAFISVGAIFRFAISLRGMQVTSWWRTPWKNAAVGGARNSLHMVGLAWDVVPVTADNEQKLRDMGLRVINEGDHLHAMI